jgi:hypothetical protein
MAKDFDSVTGGKGLTVAPSPLNEVKLDLGIILAIGVLLLLVQGRALESLSLQLLLLLSYGLLGMLWIVIRVHRVMAQFDRERERNLMARSKSSTRWLREHFTDEYVRRAQAEGYRSRAVYKLLEIQEKDRLLRPGMPQCVDLGAAPGGWSQLAARLVGPRGAVIALDMLPMEPLPGVECIQGDFRETAVLEIVEF